jgi:hypothetical protein
VSTTGPAARLLAAAAAVLAVAGLGWWLVGQKHAGALPPTVVIDDLVSDLSQSLGSATVTAGPPGDPV